MTSADMSQLTVVITNYNYARFVGAAVRSCLYQTEASVEVVVVDDGSRDDSLEVLDEFRGDITLIARENRGQAASWADGLRHSTGDVVIFLDADDTLEPNAAWVALDRFDQEPDLSMLHWAMEIIDDRGRPLGRVYPEATLPSGDLREQIRRDGPGICRISPTSGNAFPRAFLRTALPVTGDLYHRGGGDLYLSWLACASGPVAVHEEPLSCYRRHYASDSAQGSADDHIDRGMLWIEDVFRHVVTRLGLPPDVIPTWRRHEWWCQLDALRALVRREVDADVVLVLDGAALGLRGGFAGKHVIAVAEQGPPEHGEEVVEELSRHLARGLTHLVIAEPAAWWPDYYVPLREWLGDRATELGRTDLGTLFRLR